MTFQCAASQRPAAEAAANGGHRARPKTWWHAGLAAGIVLLATPALSGTFDVKAPESEQGQFELESGSAYFFGFPHYADRVRSSHELALGYGLSDRVKIGVKLAFDQPLGDDLRATAVGAEALVVLRKPEAGFGLAWFTGVTAAIHDEETNVVAFGPALRFGNDKLSLTINPFFERSFGDNATPGVDFVYGWQVKKEIREGFGISIEGYGVIPDIGHAPGVSFQEHRIGPVIYLQRGLTLGPGRHTSRAMSIKDGKEAVSNGEGPKWSLEAGVLFGLTEATQDVAVKVKTGISW